MSQGLAHTAGTPAPSGDEGYTAHALARIRDALSGLRFGTVTVIVQDGVVVQVERTGEAALAQKGARIMMCSRH